MGEIMKSLFEGTWVQEEGNVRVFLLEGKENALVIDTGLGSLDIHSIVKSQTKLPYRLLNTHADPDHIGDNSQFVEFFMHPSEAAFYRNAHNGKGRILSVYDGDVIDLGGRKLEIIHLPGHTPGSITVLDRKSRCLIGGDPIQENGNIYMFGPHRDMDAYISSLERLQKRSDFDFIYPSHAKEKVSRDVIAHLIDGAKAILGGKVKGEELEMHGKRCIRCDVGVCAFLCDQSMVGRDR